MRRPNLRNAILEVGVAAASFVAGLAGSLAVAGAIAAVAIAHWAWTRRAALAAMEASRRWPQVAIALAVMLGVVAVCYGLGALWRSLTA